MDDAEAKAVEQRELATRTPEEASAESGSPIAASVRSGATKEGLPKPLPTAAANSAPISVPKTVLALNLTKKQELALIMSLRLMLTSLQNAPRLARLPMKDTEKNLFDLLVMMEARGWRTDVESIMIKVRDHEGLKGDVG